MILLYVSKSDFHNHSVIVLIGMLLVRRFGLGEDNALEVFHHYGVIS